MSGKEKQKTIKDNINKLDDLSKSLLNKIITGKTSDNLKAIKELKKQATLKKGDIDIITKHIKVVEEFQKDNVKLFNKNQVSNVNNYLITLKNIASQKGYNIEYTQEGKVINTYPKGFLSQTQQKEIEDYNPQPSPAPPSPEPGPPAPQPPAIEGPKTKKSPPEKPKTLSEAFNRIKANTPGSYKDFTELLGKTTAIAIKKNFIKVVKDINVKGYSKLKVGELRKTVDDAVQQYARTEKLENIVSEIEQPKVEFEREKEKKEIAKMTPEERELMFGKPEEFDIDEYIRKKYNYPRDKVITDFLLSYDKRDNAVAYKTGRKIPEPGQFTKRNIRNTIDNFFTNNIYIQRLAKEIKNRQDEKGFRSLDKYNKAETINKALKADVSSDDLDIVLKNQEFNDFLSDIYVQVYGKKPDKPIESVNDYYNLVEDIRKLSATDDYNKLARIGADIVKYNRIVEGSEKELVKLINQEVNKPPEVRALPEGVKIKAVEEELLSDLDRYNKLAEELASETKKPEQEQDADRIKQIKEDMSKYSEGAKKQKASKAAKDVRAAKATARTGAVRPHFKNPTEKAVAAAIGETPQEQIADIKNWYIFDLPEYSTGVGNKIENPLVKQNDIRDRFMVSGTDIYTHLDSYLLDEGIMENKNFYKEHTALSSGGISRGLLDIKYDETEQEFLQKFNSGNNGLFDQDQSKKEISDFKNIYQKPGRFITGDQPLQYTNNRGITHNDKVWIDNLNIFYKGAEVE